MHGVQIGCFSCRRRLRVAVRCVLIQGVAACLALNAAAAEKKYQQGILLEVATGEKFSQTNYIYLPPALGGTSIPITSNSTQYIVTVRLGEIVILAQAYLSMSDLVINDSVSVRFEKDDTRMFIRRPNGKEYQTVVIRRARVLDSAPPPAPAPPPEAALPPRPPSFAAPLVSTPERPVTMPAATGAPPAPTSDPAVLRQGCTQGKHAPSCTMLGSFHILGNGVAKDALRAASFFKQGCDGGDARGCALLGTLYESGTGIAADPTQAVELYTRACDGGDALGCANLGAAYANGAGVAQDRVRAAALFKEACDAGQPSACVDLGRFYVGGIAVARNETHAAMLLQQGCEGGHMLGCDDLGLLYESGRGVPADGTRAVKLYQQACDNGLAVACGHLQAIRPPPGSPSRAPSSAPPAVPPSAPAPAAVVTPSEDLATFAFRFDVKRCEGGDTFTCRSVANTYETRGDLEKAAFYFQKICDARKDAECKDVQRIRKSQRP